MIRRIGIVVRSEQEADRRHTEITASDAGQVIVTTFNELGVVVNKYDPNQAREIAALLIKAADAAK